MCFIYYERKNAKHLLYLANLTKLEGEIVLRYELVGMFLTKKRNLIDKQQLKSDSFYII
jgi:hypothetical protein